MALLNQEEDELEEEQEALKEETENIKRHNKMLFDQITSNQEKLMLSNDRGTSPSQEAMLTQDSMIQLSAREGINQSQSVGKFSGHPQNKAEAVRTLFSSTG